MALEARPANLEGEGLVSVADLVRRALRMNADRVIVGEVLGDEILPMLNAMSQGRSGSMCTIHADSSAGVFRRIASYAVQAPERLPLEATNLLVAGAIHFVVFLDLDLGAEDQSICWTDDQLSTADRSATTGTESMQKQSFAGSMLPTTRPSRRLRDDTASSRRVREVVDAEGPHVISNEIYAPGPNRRAVLASPLRSNTAEELARVGHVASGHRARGLPG